MKGVFEVSYITLTDAKLPCLESGTTVGNYAVKIDDDRVVVLRQSRTRTFGCGLIGLLFLAGGLIAAFATILALTKGTVPASAGTATIAFSGIGIMGLLISLGVHQLTFDAEQREIRSVGFLGLSRTCTPASAFERVELMIDSLQFQGCTLKLHKRNGDTYGLDARDQLSSPASANQILLAAWIAMKFRIPLSITGVAISPCEAFASLLAKVQACGDSGNSAPV